MNGQAVNQQTIASMSSYIQQHDLFQPMLTVREHLMFQVLLRMDKNLNTNERQDCIQRIIDKFNLAKCAETRIGDKNHFKGISGGEMKRLSIASEVLTNPSLMFCDEPTTGLDSFMAKSIVQVLKTMALEGRTIICTIHQPSSQVFELFDSLLLMADGRVAFMGSIGDAKNFFSSQGLDTTRGTPTFNIPILGSGYKAGYWQQFVTLLWRSYVTLIRNPRLLLDRLVMYLINVFWVGIMFYNIGHAYSDASTIMGALIMVMGTSCIPPIYFALV
ncbi:unnamed protein product, partial [Oppiella nova]